MRFSIIPILIIVVVGQLISPAQADENPPLETDRLQLFEKLIINSGYRLQVYPVPTADNYIINVHRVVPENYTQKSYQKNRKPVIVQHGLLGSSNNFFINSPFVQHEYNGSCGDNFGFCLLSTGRYDLWLPNSRGNGYSDAHLDPDITNADHDYWNFSFDQMAEYDTPAVIDFVRNVTGSKTVAFIGYSQGANVLMGALSLKPAYTKVIRPAILWAPPLYINHMSSVIRFLDPLVPLLQAVAGEFVLTESIANLITEIVCQPLGAPLCSGVLDLAMGKSDHLNESRLPDYFHYMPSPVSTLDMVHFGQLYENGNFTRYDYGLGDGNQQKYNSSSAPVFPLQNIPKHYRIIVMRGVTDGFIADQDVERLIDYLQSLQLNVVDYKVPSDTWGHLDWIMGTDAGKLAYDQTITYLDQYA